jgi:phosphoribosyl 1,2-cyclic phosphate phosphodiesterase
MRLTFLGTGTSTGVPVLGCGCAVCRSDDPRDRRLRTSAVVEADGLTVVIDTGPDFRAQALRAGLARLDAVLFTHSHFDHIVGLDDVRPFLFDNRTPIPCYADAPTAAALRRVFPYAWGGNDYPGVPVLALHEVAASFALASRYGGPGRLAVTPLPAYHGRAPVLGYRLGALAYLTDVSAIPEGTLALLDGLDVLVLDALRASPHPTHFSIAEAVAMARQIGARQTYFVHMTHSVAYAATEAVLPEGIALAYDELTVDVRRVPYDVRH